MSASARTGVADDLLASERPPRSGAANTAADEEVDEALVRPLWWRDDASSGKRSAPEGLRAWLAWARPPRCAEHQLQLEAILSAEERWRHRRFRFERDRSMFLAAHVLVRRCLSRYAAVPPEDWSFRTGRYGRPEIDSGRHGGLDLRFNLSHAHGLVACVVTRGQDCGIDVEARRPSDDLLRLAGRVLDPAEFSALKAHRGAALVDRFYEHWTLKEAYIKARGLGLSLPLRSIGFRFTGPKLTGFRLGPDIGDDPSRWQFSHGTVGSFHQLAIAVRRQERARSPVLCHFVQRENQSLHR